MKRRPLIVAAAGLVLLLVAGCAPSGANTGDASPSASAPTLTPLPAAQFQTAPSADIPGLSTQSINDQDARIHTVVPQVEDHPQLNAALSAFADAQVADFRSTRVAGDNGHGFLTVTWSTLGSSASLVGFLLSAEVSPGASTAQLTTTIWYDTTAKQKLTLRDLVTAEGLTTVVDAVNTALRTHTREPDTDGATRILTTGDPAVGFDAQGRLLVGFNSHQVTEGAVGAPMFTIDVDPATILTERGTAARTATLEPKALQPPPRPTPSPRAAVDCSTAKCVALTFDDGPSSATTPRLLDILQREGVPATFFVLGNQVQANPQLVAREVAEGHEVGSHSWSHPQLTSLGPDAVRAEITKTEQAIQAATGMKPKLFRAPYGARDATIDGIIRDAGYAQVLWSVDTLDWKTRDAAQTVQAAAKAKPGAIVLMHDIHPSTIDAVPQVIASLRDQGFTFVTASQLIGTPKVGERYYGTY